MKHTNKKYTFEQLYNICRKNDWIITTCNNEKNGKPCDGVDTYQIAPLEDDCEYFGEFIGNRKENQYTFKFYI